ncbi:hypothetical protein ACFC08_18050 [Streptomyces sp. NPDC056112]|uniref:hypothetical protein n=1 Tax=Streptomyces sp. NPDC056112 TaxID=3345715 RepID=UPI0035D563E9
MTRPIADVDVPLPTLREEIAALVVRQNAQRAERSAERLRNLLAPTDQNPNSRRQEA